MTPSATSPSFTHRLASGCASAVNFEALHVAVALLNGGVHLLGGAMIQTASSVQVLFFGVIGAAESFIHFPASQLIEELSNKASAKSITLAEVAHLANDLFCKALVWGGAAALGVIAAPVALGVATACACNDVASRIENIILINTPKHELAEAAIFTCAVKISLLAGSLFALAAFGILSGGAALLVGLAIGVISLLVTYSKVENLVKEGRHFEGLS
jgi:hypothetical protein